MADGHGRESPGHRPVSTIRRQSDGSDDPAGCGLANAHKDMLRSIGSLSDAVDDLIFDLFRAADRDVICVGPFLQVKFYSFYRLNFEVFIMTNILNVTPFE